jgi:hypothetical protein
MGKPGVRAAGQKTSISSPLVKFEYNCRYLLMTFRKRIRKNEFSKNDFHTLTGYYVSLPNDQYLKFKNHCSLMFIDVQVNVIISEAI